MRRKFTPGKGASEIGNRPGGTAGNAYDERGGLYSCEFRQRRVTRTSKNGKVEVLAARFEGKRFNAPNDMVVRRDGNVYFTDPAFGNQQDTRELDFYGVYHVSRPGTARSRREVEDTSQRNCAFSQRANTVRSDSDGQRFTRTIWTRGARLEGALVIKDPGVPAGLRTDEKGNLYVAAKKVSCIRRGNWPAPFEIGGDPVEPGLRRSRLETLYITARTSVYRVRLGVKGAFPYSP